MFNADAIEDELPRLLAFSLSFFANTLRRSFVPFCSCLVCFVPHFLCSFMLSPYFLLITSHTIPECIHHFCFQTPSYMACLSFPRICLLLLFRSNNRHPSDSLPLVLLVRARRNEQFALKRIWRHNGAKAFFYKTLLSSIVFVLLCISHPMQWQ